MRHGANYGCGYVELRLAIPRPVVSGQAGVASGAEVEATPQFVEALALELMIGRQIGDDERGKADEECEHRGISGVKFLPFLILYVALHKIVSQGLPTASCDQSPRQPSRLASQAR
jgi:hypothetical protein